MRIFLVILVAGLTAGIVVQTGRYSRLRAHHRELEEQVARLQAGANEAANVDFPAPARAAPEEEQTELLRLRNQAAQLRSISNELHEARKRVDQLQAENHELKATGPSNPATSAGTSSAGARPRDSWQFSGYATPEACLESTLHAISKADYRAIMGSLTPEEAQRMQKEMGDRSPEEIGEKIRRDVAKATSYQVLERKELSPNEAMLLIYAGGEEKVQRVLLQKIGQEWRFAGPDRRGQ
jgi:cell division protein FtsB